MFPGARCQWWAHCHHLKRRKKQCNFHICHFKMCCDVLIYLHILNTLRVPSILFPLSDVGLKVPTSSFLENLKRLERKVVRKGHIDVWWLMLWWWLLHLCVLRRFVRFNKPPPNILSSFHQILALSIDFCIFLPSCTPENPPLSARPAEQLLAPAQEPKLREDQAWD